MEVQIRSAFEYKEFGGIFYGRLEDFSVVSSADNGGLVYAASVKA